ncbi:KGGVGR-motif variant AAA ATPase [Sphingobium yanoikuyae]|jgi:Mrp family chromosome partitioning ATPase|uniref:KGGVGR-motif variant AAA ATPase n=1 Tax=Sphingobium yanoikuyae TaxID=13690 RepID=UPI0006894D2D|nr:AAA family ATPase [Sphingobium yanoikuyae]MDV3477882.1 AAA family ATPase [Sphingobium yanoikuyae]
MTVRFDESLPALVDFVAGRVGVPTLARSVFLRDATGFLSVIIDDSLSEEAIEQWNEDAVALIGSYARSDGCVRDRSAPGASRLLAAKDAASLRMGEHAFRFVDRRMVGADWLLPPANLPGGKRIAFASIKGGVGRSTALAVTAAYLSARGLRVLAIDLDLEAPGIGSMLLSDAVMPTYGSLDYLVENGISQIDEDFLTNVSGKSTLGGSGGQVTVVPAFGRATLENPAGGLAKIARAYLEDVAPEGPISLTEQVRQMVLRLEGSGSYDVTLIDARAGLHETTAAVLLGLGAETLLFGIDEPQTFQGYRLLMAHLAARRPTGLQEWRERLQFVHAKATASTADQIMAARRFHDLLAIFDVNEPENTEGADLTANDFDLEWTEDELEVDSLLRDDTPVIPILDDSRYRGFNPIQQPELLNTEVFSATFGKLMNWVERVATGAEDE